MAGYDDQVVEKYLEVLRNEEMDYWWNLDEEEDCKAVMAMLECVGGNVSAVTDTEYVELFLNTHSVSECI